MKLMQSAALLLAFFSLGGCSTLFDKHVEWEYVEPDQYPVLTAIGYAPIDAQLGQSDSVKMLQALKASKLDAYRELAEQVYGHKLSGKETLADMVLQDASLKSNVDGVIRGARVVKSYPIGDDTYATELELDMRRVYDIYLATAKPKRVRDVKYY